MTIPLHTASQLVDLALQHARDRDFNPLTVVVLDAGGHVKAAKREDGSGILRFEIALGKAWGALGMGRASRALAASAAERPAFFGALSGLAGGRVVPVPGGVLIRDGGGTLIGAIGVTGDTSDADEECAVYAIEESGLAADIGG